jgi:hypothetical protein
VPYCVCVCVCVTACSCMCTRVLVCVCVCSEQQGGWGYNKGDKAYLAGLSGALVSAGAMCREVFTSSTHRQTHTHTRTRRGGEEQGGGER